MSKGELKVSPALDTFLENMKVMKEFADVEVNRDVLVGWGIYIPEKEAVIILGGPEDEAKARKLVKIRNMKGRKDQLIPLFKPHAGIRIQREI